jgi:hypothetical protein
MAERAGPRFAYRCWIAPTMRAASLPTPWIIVDDMECWKCWPTK